MFLSVTNIFMNLLMFILSHFYFANGKRDSVLSNMEKFHFIFTTSLDNIVLYI